MKRVVLRGSERVGFPSVTMLQTLHTYLSVTNPLGDMPIVL